MSLLEGLENRRLFAASFTPGVSLAGPAPLDYAGLGQVIATKGSLAAVAGTGGTVRLYDTSAGTMLGEFADPTGEQYTGFGASLTFLGEDKLAIGAPYAGMGAGAVHVFGFGASSTFSTSFTGEELTGLVVDPENPPFGTNFGAAVADYHGNLLISVTADSTIGGVGRVFEVDPETRAFSDRFYSPESSFDDQFGRTLAVDGDNILFAAQRSGEPVVYMFDGSDFYKDPTNLHVFTAPSYASSQGLFGLSMALSGNNVVIGAPSFNSTGSPVYHFNASTAEPPKEFSLPGSGWVGFGQALAISGDTLVVGAFNTPDATGYDTAGTVFAYKLSTGELLASVTNPAGAGMFGHALGTVGPDQFIIGDPASDVAGPDAGAVYLYSLTEDETPPPPPATPVNMVGNDLVVTGTDGADAVSFTTDDLGRVYVVLNAVSYGPFSPTGAIVVHGGDGDDVILGNKAIPVNLEIYGGAGNDVIAGGGANDVLVAGTGNDQVTAGTGRDLIIGSEGADSLIGKPGQDIVIAGRTLHDADPVALRAILNEWTNGGTVERRADNIRNTAYATASRLNGNYFLIPGSTVFDDGAVDTLSGGGGKDWLMFNVTGTGVLDILTDGDKNDLITDL